MLRISLISSTFDIIITQNISQLIALFFCVRQAEQLNAMCQAAAMSSNPEDGNESRLRVEVYDDAKTTFDEVNPKAEVASVTHYEESEIGMGPTVTAVPVGDGQGRMVERLGQEVMALQSRLHRLEDQQADKMVTLGGKKYSAPKTAWEM